MSEIASTTSIAATEENPAPKLAEVVLNSEEMDSMKNSAADIIWSDELESRLYELYLKDNVADIFCGRRVEEHLKFSTTWQIFVVTRGLFRIYAKTEIINDQVICFIEEEAGFSSSEYPPDHPLQIPKDLQIAFNKIIENELGSSFRDAHYNLVGISTGYKHQNGQLTEPPIPAIILYVRQKGILRRGCDGLFPKNICGFPTDVVEACIAVSCSREREKERERESYGKEYCQRYQADISLGLSIGLGLGGLRQTTGTLGAIARDIRGQIGLISCEHVLKFQEGSSTNEKVYQPSHKDLLEIPKKKLDEVYERLKKKENEEEKYELEYLQRVLDHNKKKDTLLATYERGMRENFLSDKYNEHYGIDAAFCIFNNHGRRVYPKEFAISPNNFKDAGLSSDTYLNGIYTYEKMKRFDRVSTKVFKVGRTTGLTLGKWLPIDLSVAIDFKKDVIKSAKEKKVEGSHNFDDHNDVNQEIFIKYLKSAVYTEIRERRNLCYPIKWFDRQSLFQFDLRALDCGDSGASIVDEEGYALGILHAKWQTNVYTCAIASPYFAVFEALNIDERSFPPELA